MNESNEKKIEGEKLTIEDVFQRRLEILSNPTAFTQKIAHFCAVGLGACVYSKDVSIAELVHCWEFDEFKFSCPECGETAYIYQFAGHTNGGGYWALHAYCPKCQKHLHYGRSSLGKTHWSALKNITTTASQQIQQKRKL